MTLGRGTVLGRYELLCPLAKGGMAEVWAAQLRGSRGFQKLVAIKTVLRGVMEDARLEEMFLAEAMLASKTHHPNVVETLELGEHEGTLYLVMEWVDGESLRFIMARAAEHGGVPLAVGINMIGQACKGLHAAHQLADESGTLLGLVHRDISPENVLVTYAGNVKLVDFGVAKTTARSAGLTEAGEVKGKFAFMAPEQVAGKAVNRRTDIFGMGVLLYLLTTGRHPFGGAHPAETVHKIYGREPPPRPSTYVEGYPLELEDVVLRALAKAPDDRWATAQDMLTALEQAAPQCFEGSFEARIVEFMQGLLASRARERREQLKTAQKLVARDRGEDPASSSNVASVGSLRALSVDWLGSDTGTASRVAVELDSGPRSHDTLASSTGRKSIRGRSVAMTIAVLGIGVLGFLLRSKSLGRADRTAAASVALASDAGPTTSPPPPPPAAAPSPVVSMAPVQRQTPPDRDDTKHPRKATIAQPRSGEAAPDVHAAEPVSPREPSPAPSAALPHAEPARANPFDRRF